MFSSSAGGGSGLVSYSAIARQPSIYSSTLEELQNAINEPGKKFGSMNMEEFIKNIWAREDGQAVPASTVASDPRAGTPSLQRRNNLVLPLAMSGKIGDETWKNIHPHPPDADCASKLKQPSPPPPPWPPQETMGEVTLEDFLLRAGIAKEEADSTAPLSSSPVAHLSKTDGSVPGLYSPISTNGALTSLATDNLAAPDWLNFANRQQHQQLVQQADAAAAKRGRSPAPFMLPGGNLMYDGILDGAGYGPGSGVNGLALSPTGLALSPVISDFSMHGKKRSASKAVIEKTVERRQRRMIKNRESAARSRARKQAYTVELEAEVTQLKEENARLQRQQALRSRLPETGDPQHLQIRVLQRTRSW